MSKVSIAFDTVASTYDSWYLQPKGKQVFEAERDALEAFIPNTGVGIEIGAGTGIFTLSLSSFHRTIIALDLSGKMLSSAVKRGVPSILGGASNLPIRSNILDFSFMITAMEFIEDPSRAMADAHRVLKIGGSLVILFINRESPWGEQYRKMGENGDPIFSKARLYSVVEMEIFVKASPLKLIEIKGTLTTGPTDPDSGNQIVEPSNKAGVILVKALKTVR